MRRVAPFALMLSVAACSQGVEQPDQAASAQSEPAVAAQAPSGAATPAASPGAALPAPGDTPRYVGRWASREDLCEGGAWTFTRDSAALEDGPTCHFDSVSEIPGGYHVTATCEQDGKSRKGMATLRFAESARAMLVENLATLPDTGLIYCGPAPQAPEGAGK
jgi:hypothetical protein